MDNNENISILVPTRGRPEIGMKRLCKSIKDTVSDLNKVEVIFYIDDDDKDSKIMYDTLKSKMKFNILAIIGKRIVLSNMWNECYKKACGPIYHHCGDDIVFRTNNWDLMVNDVFNKYSDKIVLVYGKDREITKFSRWAIQWATHGFIHKNWIETVGYFVPPFFSSDMNDKWITEVAMALNRRHYIPDLYTEHMHWAFGKGPKDKTHMDRLKRGKKDNVKKLYKDLEHERINNINKLKKFIMEFNKENNE